MAAFMGIISQISVSQAIATSAGGEQLTYQVESKPFGISYEDWTAKWWQWLLSIPTPDNPAVDTTGEYCGVGQNRSAWFLAGTTGGKNVRTCTIPSGTAILIPVLNPSVPQQNFLS